MYAVSQAVLLVLLARDVGPREFGIVAAFMAAHTFLFLLAGMNTPTFVTREYALGRVATATAAIRLNAALLASAIAVAAASSLVMVDSPWLLLAILGNAIALWSDRVTENRLAIDYARRKVGIPAATLAVRAVVPLVLYLVITGSGTGALVAFAAARLLAGLASQCLGVLLVRLPEAEAAVSFRELLRAQLPLATTTAMGALRTLDVVVVIGIAGAAASGLYSAISKVVSPFNTLAVALAPVLIPRAAVMDPAELRKLLDRLMLAGIVLSSCMLVLIPFAERLVVLVFGAQFTGGGAVLVWVLLRVGPVAAAPLMSTALQSNGLDRVAAVNSLVTSAVTLAAVVVGTILAGAAGAAAGFALIGLLGMIALWSTGRRSVEAAPRARATAEV